MNRMGQSLDNLFSIIEQQRQKILMLSGLVHRLVTKGGPDLTGTFCDVLLTREEIPDYLREHDCDYLLILIPGKLPVVAMDREEIDRMLETGELQAWLKENWETNTLAIAVP